MKTETKRLLREVLINAEYEDEGLHGILGTIASVVDEMANDCSGNGDTLSAEYYHDTAKTLKKLSDKVHEDEFPYAEEGEV